MMRGQESPNSPRLRELATRRCWRCEHYSEQGTAIAGLGWCYREPLRRSTSVERACKHWTAKRVGIRRCIACGADIAHDRVLLGDVLCEGCQEISCAECSGEHCDRCVDRLSVGNTDS